MKTSSADTEFQLEWIKVNDWVMETECRRFQCRKYFSGDVLSDDPGERRYQLIRYGMKCGPPQESFAMIRRFAETA